VAIAAVAGWLFCCAIAIASRKVTRCWAPALDAAASIVAAIIPHAARHLRSRLLTSLMSVTRI
jgi:hypothetical protein